MFFIEGKGGYNSISIAIDHATDGDKILVYGGTYYGTLLVNKSISLISMDINNTILTYKENKVGTYILGIKADDCIISGFKIKGVNNSSGVSGIDIFSANNIIVNNTIVDTNYGIYIENDLNANWWYVFDTNIHDPTEFAMDQTCEVEVIFSNVDPHRPYLLVTLEMKEEP